ncbi:MAG: transporter substrate-binding domain-containing protein [Desulfovibrio sp.]|nr:transporter substrate-binding domain-containing protein [Desulfovibrio sp.]
MEIQAKNCYSETLHVVTDIDYTPFSYVDGTGTYAGMDVELMNEIANRLHMNLDLQLLDWPAANRRFRSGEAQIIMNMETDLVAEDPSMLVTIPTVEKQYVVYGRESVTSVADLYGRRVASLHRLPELGLDREITYMDSYENIFAALKKGEYDFAVCPVQVGNYFLRKLHMDDVAPSYAVNHVYGALALGGRDAALRDRLNPVIKQLWQEGRIDRLNEKWVRHYYVSMTMREFIERHPWLWALLAFLLFSLFSMVAYSRFQRRAAAVHKAHAAQLQQHLATIEEQKKTLEEAKRRAEEGSRAKTLFLSNMSHDIRTPMNAIIGFTNLALRAETGLEAAREYLAKIGAAGRHLLSLINDILEMSRIESGKIELDVAPVLLPALLDELHTFLMAQTAEKRQTLRIDAYDVTDECVVCDKLRLNQVLLNLASNAVKYTPEGGEISIRLFQRQSAQEGRGVFELRVKDNGIGMTPEFAAKIFDAFERERTSTVSGIQGTGLGMAIAKRIVELMGGTIMVTTAKGKGTEVTVTLPLPVVPVAETGDTGDVSLENRHVLVADADPATRSSVCGMARRLGMNPQEAANNAAALTLARQQMADGNAFDVCIVERAAEDMGEDGPAQRLRDASDAGRPLVIVTGYEENLHPLPEGMVFCRKPLFASTLRAALYALYNVRADAPRRKGALADNGTADFSGLRVLLVDDMEVNREIAVAMLEMNGFIVEQAADGGEAVEKCAKAESGYYSVVLMDIQMPVMNGYEATKAIRALPDSVNAAVPILALSANAFDEDVKASLAAGMNGHLAKPIDMDKLFGTLKETLAR